MEQAGWLLVEIRLGMRRSCPLAAIRIHDIRGVMNPYRIGLRSVASLVVVAFAFFAILSQHPKMDDTGWNVLVSVTAALAIHVMGLVSSLSLGPRKCDRE